MKNAVGDESASTYFAIAPNEDKSISGKTTHRDDSAGSGAGNESHFGNSFTKISIETAVVAPETVSGKAAQLTMNVRIINLDRNRNLKINVRNLSFKFQGGFMLPICV